MSGPRLVGSTAERRIAAMGTLFNLRVAASTREMALAASEAAVGEIERIENLLSTRRRDGPLAALNAAQPGQEIPLDSESLGLLSEVFDWRARTEGAFDPSVGSLVSCWDLRGAGRIPSPSKIEGAKSSLAKGAFHLDRARRTATRLHESAAIDEGAWGKGYALDRALDVLREAGASKAVLDLGGHISALAADPAHQEIVALAHPRDRRRPVLELRLRNGSVSTSGDSERSAGSGAKRIGHLLDPRTGRPAQDFGSVTVTAPRGLVADILSTAFFVLGPMKGMRLSDDLRRDGVDHEVLFLIVRGDALEARCSPDFPLFDAELSGKALQALSNS